MALLLYCVTDSSEPVHSISGVAGLAVLELKHAALQVFYSENQSSEIWLREPLQISAPKFHRVQRELFRSAAIIPFRFPTIVESADKLREHLDQRSAEYKSLLRRFATAVQMDITLRDSSSPPDHSSGARYLRDRQNRSHRLEQFAAEIRRQANGVVQNWRQRSLSNGLCCFALVQREQVGEFNEKMKTISVPEELSARISGPWPVAEFLDFST